MSGLYVRRGIFLTAVLFCISPWASPPVALAVGLGLALTLGHPFKQHNSKVTKYLLQVSVVGLGFGMNFSQVVSTGKTGIMFTVVSIMGTLAVGYLIGRLLKVSKKTSYLVSAGTAICGGSAIAAVAPVIDADEKDVAISLGTVFILNSVALFVFPVIGHVLGLTGEQFGMWSAIAIHDTSSVVGAAAQYGSDALAIATPVKLTRALWIVPIALLTAVVVRNKSAKISFPYFIVLFVLASVVVSVFPAGKTVYSGVVSVAKTGLTLTLFFIGAGLSREILKSVGLRPVVQGIALWCIVSVVSFVVIRSLSL